MQMRFRINNAHNRQGSEGIATKPLATTNYKEKNPNNKIDILTYQYNEKKNGIP
mgnify:FL=1